MMNINALLTGYIEVVLKGDKPERVINMAMMRGIYLWDIRQEKDGCFYLKIRVGGYKALRHLVRRNECKVKIVKKRGFPFVLMRYKKRKVLALGIIFFCIVLYTLSSFVWFVEITGNERVELEKVISVVEANGLRVGVFKSSIDSENIKFQLLKNVPELSWVNIRIKGTKAIVEVVEKSTNPLSEDAHVGDIIAAMEGEIEELLVLSGTSLVKEGEKVKKGQVIISGLEYPHIILNEDGTYSPGGEPQMVRARGVVRARVVREIIGECMLNEEENIDTGEEISIVMIKYGDYNIILKGPKTVPYKHFRTITQSKRVLFGRNKERPVELVTIIYREQKHESRYWGIEGAYQEAINRARNELKGKLPEDYRIINEGASPVPTDNDSIVKVKYVLETIENIGEYVY